MCGNSRERIWFTGLTRWTGSWMFGGTADCLTELEQVKTTHTSASPLRQHSTLAGRLLHFHSWRFTPPGVTWTGLSRDQKLWFSNYSGDEEILSYMELRFHHCHHNGPIKFSQPPSILKSFPTYEFLAFSIVLLVLSFKRKFCLHFISQYACYFPCLLYFFAQTTVFQCFNILRLLAM